MKQLLNKMILRNHTKKDNRFSEQAERSVLISLLTKRKLKPPIKTDC